MKIVFFSDTHGWHDSLTLPEVDIAICCGDISMRGLRTEVVSFMDWFMNQPVKHRVMIAGNHDYWFDTKHPKSLNYRLEDNSHLDVVPDGIIYLQDSDVTIEGIKIWGSPVTPWFHNWAFNMLPEDLETYWDQIPDDADIVITHGPCANTLLDKCLRGGARVGCPSLTKRIANIRPKILAFGHIHEAYGIDDKFIPDDDGVEKMTRLINCSYLDFHYQPTNEPVLIDWEEFCKLHENDKREEV
jgi:predicted phosphohydrolase